MLVVRYRRCYHPCTLDDVEIAFIQRIKYSFETLQGYSETVMAAVKQLMELVIGEREK